MNVKKVYFINAVLIIAVVTGTWYCKHVSKKVNEPENANKISSEIVAKKDIDKKKDKKSGPAEEYDPMMDQHLQYMMNIQEYMSYRFGPAGKPIPAEEGVDKPGQIYVQPICVDGFRWIMFAGTYNGKMVLDVEQVEGYGGPVACY